MPLENWERVQDLFFAAADLTHDEQARFLAEHCGSDPVLLLEVKSLLAADPKNNQPSIDIAQEKVLLIDLLLASGKKEESLSPGHPQSPGAVAQVRRPFANQ